MKLIQNIIIVILISINSAFALIDTNADTAIIMDADTGYILYEKNVDKKVFPASMTKIMTSMIVFEKLSNGSLTLDDTFLVSEKAWKEREGSSMFVEVDKEIRVEDLLRGIIVQSGNDACIVVAENISGSEKTFSILMNEMASDIGLENTNFANSTGMHNVKNYSTVSDIAKMSQYMINKYPKFYHLFSETEFEWSGIAQKNRNPLLYKNIGADGLKTGYLSISGYGLAASAKNDNRRLIVVGHGFTSPQKRSQGTARLLNWGFREYTNIKLHGKDSDVGFLPLTMASEDKVSLTTDKDIVITVAKAKKDAIETEIIPIDSLKTPFKKGDVIAMLKVTIPKANPQYIDLVATKNIDEAGYISSFIAYIYNSVVSFFD
ncbi:D-alanyl-D-alanine carboxypeptidase [Pelagibacteraceae bacterium]|jgi:D-alanyl-D-alanine carboxypeptidase (penicillin-binding protein 5/6)|nr:D-alanyl-D-alanine carboxypeptidase [Pelagibacteraceae bacterium]